MVDRSVLQIAKRYLRALKLSGIHVRRAVLFGSHVRGTATPDSDIDLVVVAPEFDPPRNEDPLIFSGNRAGRPIGESNPSPAASASGKPTTGTLCSKLSAAKAKLSCEA